MDLEVIFFGTGPSAPSARRSTACTLIRAGGRKLLFDCGEGSQRQMMKGGGLVQVDEIYLSHFHGDHVLGLPGLLKTYELHGRVEPLAIVGPAGLRQFFSVLIGIVGRLGYELELIELEPGEEISYSDFEVRAFEVLHRGPAFGYAFVEDERPGRVDAEKAVSLGVEFGPDIGLLQRGESVRVASGTVTPEQVVGPVRRGRKIVISGDTAACSMTKIAAFEADLLVHEATFMDVDLDRASATGHSTARQAAALAHDAQVEMLALVHISSRYYRPDLLEEAVDEFPNVVMPRDFDLIEVPAPDRGGPELVPRGARPRPVAGKGLDETAPA